MNFINMDWTWWWDDYEDWMSIYDRMNDCIETKGCLTNY